MYDHTNFYIDGQWVPSAGGRTHEVVNPATERPIATVTLGSAADVDRAVAAARAAFASWSETSVEERIGILERVIGVYKRRIPDLAKAMSEEMGAPISFAQSAQAPAGLGHFVATLAALRAFSFADRIGKAVVRHEPIGVVALITPWNWPMNQICAKVAPALAAGNTMILKPSEEAPGCAVILAEILHEAGVPAGVFNLVNGDGPVVGNALSSHADIDMISFTGSTRAGIAIAHAAADTVKRVHQELGGKAANLVLEGADLPATLPLTLVGVLANSGQSCIAPTRLLVHTGQIAEATAIAKAVVERTTVGDPSEQGSHLGPVVNARQYDVIQSLIRSALDEGATLVTGGLGRPDGRETGYYVRPTVLADVTPDMRIAKEETFGPVATIMAYADEADALRIANGTEFGLSAAITGDPQAAARIAPKLRAGLVTINSWSPDFGAPFGGYKQSGNGREHGTYGLADFMEVKTIIGLPVE